MQVGTGKSILNGIAIGKLKIYKKKDTVISAAEVADTAAEVARFEDARAKAIDQQTALYEKALAEAGEDIAEVFNIHAMMLDDDDFVDAIKEIINGQHKCAEYAVKTAGNNQAAVFSAMDDPYLQARSADVLDIAQAMLDILQGVDNASLQGTEPSILVAEDLAPSETVRMDKSLLLGFITREGSSNSHTAILARSMNIPALIQCKDIQDDWDGKMAVVDGYNACVYVDPTPDLLKSLKKRQQEDQKKQALLQELKGKPNTTLDGKTINVFANIGGMGDVGAVQQNDAGGVGLFRTEFVYLNCKDFPTEDYQFEAYKQVLESLAPRKVVVRTCDIGADKTVDYMKLDHEENPALGYRAIRICLTRKDFFKTQLRALLRASAYGNMSIMFPMITSLRELQDAKAVLDECRTELRAEGKKFDEKKFELACKHANRTAQNWLKVCDFLQYKPAPMSGFDLFNHMADVVTARGKEAAADAFELLSKDLQKNIEEGTSTLPFPEQYRVMFEGIPCWPKLPNLFKPLKENGINVTAVVYAPAFGFVYNNMDEMARAYYKAPNSVCIEQGVAWREGICRDNKVDGVLVHYNRSCKPWSGYMAEMQRRFTADLGVPCAGFDGDQADPRNFNEAQYTTRVQGLVEAMEANKKD